MTAPATSVDLDLLAAWARGRSLSRGLPPPVVDGAVIRVETGQPAEERRYLFPAPGPAIATLAAAIDRPAILIKACAPLADLLAWLPDGWRGHPQAYFMACDGAMRPPPPLPAGYTIALRHEATVRVAEVSAGTTVVARGRASPGGGVVVFDQIATDPAHRRRGLGHSVMAALATGGGGRHVLTATAAGHGLYTALGWSVLSLYSTAEFGPAAAGAVV